MKKQSAGLLLYRRQANGIEVLIVHPGGPFWAKKDAGAWSIPKGEFEDDEPPEMAARREFSEEMGLPAPEGQATALGSAKQSSGKVVYIWTLEADLDPQHVKSNMFDMEWPPRSGKVQAFPEVDRAGWFPLAEARGKLVKGQAVFIERLAEQLGVTPVSPSAMSMEGAPSVEEPSSPSQTSLF